MGDKSEASIEVENSSGATVAGRDNHGIPPEQHERMMKEALAGLRVDLEAKHTETHRANAAEHQLEIHKLQSQISEYERRLADPEAAYREYQAKITELEQLLEEATVDIGANRIRDAQAALSELDYSKADAIFAEVEQIEKQAVTRAARAAYGRGLVAEEQVRWGAAAEHYSKAARLDPSYDTMFKAGEFLWRMGQHDKAVRQHEELVAFARSEYGDSDEKTAAALNNLAQSYQAKGDYDGAEPLMRQALAITEKALGTDHPDYGIDLNNLASLLYAKGDYDGAEPLMRQALVVFEAALGAEHPNSQIVRRNLDVLLREKP